MRAITNVDGRPGAEGEGGFVTVFILMIMLPVMLMAVALSTTMTGSNKNLVEAIQLIIETNRQFAREESDGQEVIREEVTVSV